MKLVPLRSILFSGVILLILSLIVINVGASLWENNQNPTNTGSNNASFVGSNTTAEELERAQDTIMNNPVLLPLLNFLAIVGFVVFILLANLSYLYVVNTSDVVQLVQTSLRLAGFSIRVKKIGRVWQISENTILTLHGGIHPFFSLNYQPSTRKINPLMFGLAVSNNQISQNIDADSLQLTLQSFHRFLVAEAEI